jgi:hypothetical protein
MHKASYKRATLGESRIGHRGDVADKNVEFTGVISSVPNNSSSLLPQSYISDCSDIQVTQSEFDLAPYDTPADQLGSSSFAHFQDIGF